MLLLLIEPPIVENSRADTEILLGLMREIVPLDPILAALVWCTKTSDKSRTRRFEISIMNFGRI
jgi:hypothetical protein